VNIHIYEQGDDMTTKQHCSRLCHRVTGKTIRILSIRAGFPYHKAPHLYQWLWVFILLPFLEEASLNDLIEKHGKALKKLYGILQKYPECFERLVKLISLPLFLEVLEEFPALNETAKSRQRIRLLVDDTKAEKYGKCMEFLHKLYDHCTNEYIMGYNYVLLLVVSGSLVFPLSFVLWLPQSHPDHRSKNDIVRDEIKALQAACEAQEMGLDEVEGLFDSAYCKQKVVLLALLVGLRVISKPGNTHKFEFEGEVLTPKEITEKVKARQWKYLDPNTWYHRVLARHHRYGEVVLVVRRRQLKNQKIIYDVLFCNKRFYSAVRIHTSYKARWEIELHFKYYKQYLSLGKAQFGKLGSIRSQLACVALAGLIVALFCHQIPRKPSFRRTVRMIAQELRDG
jgi:hypothetical protein